MLNRTVLVTTEYKGVFFGTLIEYDREARRLTLKKAKNVIYWSGTRGFLGLASHGPESGSRIGSEALEIELHGVTSVTLCTDEASEVFRGWR